MIKRTMNNFATLLLVVLALSLAASASQHPDCRSAFGNLNVINNGNGTTSGTIRQAGHLNGTVQGMFTSVFTPTPDATTVSFTDDLTLTTRHGVLRTHNVGIFDLAAGLFSAINRIDPNASTGDFAGATGVLYVNGVTTDGGATFQALISGQVCYAN